MSHSFLWAQWTISVVTFSVSISMASLKLWKLNKVSGSLDTQGSFVTRYIACSQLSESAFWLVTRRPRSYWILDPLSRPLGILHLLRSGHEVAEEGRLLRPHHMSRGYQMMILRRLFQRSELQVWRCIFPEKLWLQHCSLFARHFRFLKGDCLYGREAWHV